MSPAVLAPWVIAPVVLPALTAALILLLLRHRLAASRIVSLLACAALVALGAVLTAHAGAGAVETYALGDWPAPFGIVLVLDRLSALMVLLTGLLALGVMAYAAATGLDRRGWHFHPMFQFQLLGLNGAFLTGDLFNLFVFFEVMLIASYGLMLHGQGAGRIKAGVRYVIVNLAGSTLFLVAVGLLYGVTGTLNMADLSVRVAQAPSGDQALIAAAGLLLMAVFALKAAVAPLHLWLPGTYAATSGAAAALFAIMTKVGAYALIRVGTLIFGAGAGSGPFLFGPWLLPAALATTAIAFIGLFAAHGLRALVAWAVLGSMGTLMAAVAVFTPEAMAAALYYLPHSTLAGAAAFLVADQIAARRGDHADALVAGPKLARHELMGALFFLAALALVGLPPLSGFVGKLLILDGVRAAPGAAWIWAVILVTTVIGVLGWARAGSRVFWKAEPGPPSGPSPTGDVAALASIAALFAALGLLTVLAGPAHDYARAAAAQLFAPADYLAAVLGPEAGGRP